MNGLSRNKADRAKTITFHILSGRHHFALSTLYTEERSAGGPHAQNARQEVEINFISKEHQQFSVFGLFLVLFQLFDLAPAERIRAGNREHRTQHSIP